MSKQLSAAVARGFGHPRLTFTWAARPALAVALALAGSALLGGPAYAATTTAGELQEVIVTAEKREATVQATPISISALSNEQLSALAVPELQDLTRSVPGVSFRTAGPGQTELEMRGLASSGGSVATVGFYLDETPLSANTVALNGRTVIDADLYDLNHVEVLRGPQGTLYGAGSMGGTLKLATNPPKLGAFEGSVSANTSKTSSGGDVNGGANVMLNFPIGETAALRVVASGKYVSGWVPRYVIEPGQFPYPTNPGCCGFYYGTRGDVLSAPVAKVIPHSNTERFQSVRAALLIKPSDNLSITVNTMYQRIDAEGYNNYQQGPGPAVIGVWQPYDIKEPYYDQFRLASITVKYNFGFAELTSATNYWNRDVTQSTDGTEPLQNIFNFAIPNPNGNLAGIGPNFIPGYYQEYDPTHQLTEELRLTSTGTGPFQWVTGLYFQNLHSGYVTFNQNVLFANAQVCPQVGPVTGAPPPPNPLAGFCPAGSIYNPNFPYTGDPTLNPQGVVFNDNNPNQLKQFAVFGDVSYKFTPALKLTTGLRVFKFDDYNIAHQTGLGTATGNKNPVDLVSSGEGTAVLPKVNLSYEPTPDLTYYGTISRGSRPGGNNLPLPTSLGAAYYCGPGTGPSTLPAGTQLIYYGPDSIWSAELGEKWRFADRRFTLNADFFYVKWTNIQQDIELSCGYPYNRNIGGAKAYGPEVEFSARLTDAWTFLASGAYTKAYLSNPINSVDFNQLYHEGTRIIDVPQYTYVLAVTYEQTYSNGLRGSLRIADNYTGAMEDTAFYRQVLPSYSIVDLHAGIGRGAWSAFLFGKNLTNKVASQTIDNTQFAWQQPTITRVSTNQPRTIGVEMNYKF